MFKVSRFKFLVALAIIAMVASLAIMTAVARAQTNTPPTPLGVVEGSSPAAAPIATPTPQDWANLIITVITGIGVSALTGGIKWLLTLIHREASRGWAVAITYGMALIATMVVVLIKGQLSMAGLVQQATVIFGTATLVYKFLWSSWHE